MTAVAGASAPGKLFLTGEYVVLAGAPALVAAVDRRVSVRVTVGEGTDASLDVRSLAEGRYVTLPAPGDGALETGDVGAVNAALRAVSAAGIALRQVTVEVDSRGFLAGGEKLGLGRSAATLAAAVWALLAAGGAADADRARIALGANALFQRGRGSGADVAAAVHGGVVEVTRRGAALDVARRRLPPGVQVVVGWTGSGAPTVALLDRFAEAEARAPEATAELTAAAGAAAAAAACDDAPALLAAVDRSGDLLARLGTVLGLPIVTPALARLVAAARRAGAAAKPSGAGGGDCGIALADSPAQAEAVRAAWRAEGIVPLPLAVGAAGARDEPHAEAAREAADA
jgi:phosphomevalonate kinase